ncbi:MAG TPA: POTRA domain-containing protein [Pyrinomonadaceae bacterium]|nr:POTRA domain-containing protein [Pyrinomonadaceae bacterium]
MKDSTIQQLSIFSLAALVLLACPFATWSQVPAEKCRGPVYDREDVSKPAIVREQPDFHMLFDALGAQTQIHVTLDVVLCRSARVTDIRVTKSEPPNAAEWVVAAVSLISFTPAEMNWHTVSQGQRFDFRFNDRGVTTMNAAPSAKRLVEEVDIVGNRRVTKEEILGWIKTRPGDRYDPAQVTADLQTILASGYFNKLSTRVTIEDGVRGGVCVIFEVAELPLIAEIAFTGLERKRQSEIVDEFTRQHVDLRVGKPLNSVEVKKATKVIEDYFRAQGWLNVKADASIENLTATQVKLVFRITATNF